MGSSAGFYNPSSIIIDSSSNLFIADSSNKIRKVTTYGLVVTFAGTGTGSFINGVGSSATFYIPAGIAVDASNNLYVSDSANSGEFRVVFLCSFMF